MQVYAMSMQPKHILWASFFYHYEINEKTNNEYLDLQHTLGRIYYKDKQSYKWQITFHHILQYRLFSNSYLSHLSHEGLLEIFIFMNVISFPQTMQNKNRIVQLYFDFRINKVFLLQILKSFLDVDTKCLHVYRSVIFKDKTMESEVLHTLDVLRDFEKGNKNAFTVWISKKSLAFILCLALDINECPLMSLKRFLYKRLKNMGPHLK